MKTGLGCPSDPHVHKNVMTEEAMVLQTAEEEMTVWTALNVKKKLQTNTTTLQGQN